MAGDDRGGALQRSVSAGRGVAALSSGGARRGAAGPLSGHFTSGAAEAVRAAHHGRDRRVAGALAECRSGDSDSLRQPLRRRRAGFPDLARGISADVAELRADAPADRLAWSSRLCGDVRCGARVQRRTEPKAHSVDGHSRRRLGHRGHGACHHLWVPRRTGTDLTLLELFEPFEPFEPSESFIGGAFMIPAHFLQPTGAAGSMTAEELAIARSVLYAALFDYPLTLAQLRQTLIESAQTPSQILETYDQSDALQTSVEYREGFFFPRGRFDLVQCRRDREARSRVFLERHHLLLTLVAAMPYVRMVALSGSIAHLNLEGDGDLDLFVVTRGRHVWSVTVAIVVLAKLLRRRRTVCANFVLADSRLSLDQQDLFTASQIVHLKSLIGHDV